jgi:integrase
LLHARITKNGKTRWLPFNKSLGELLRELRAAHPDQSAETCVMRVCQKSIDRAAKLTRANRITHHDLRHLFATRCIENGVDIPTCQAGLATKTAGRCA